MTNEWSGEEVRKGVGRIWNTLKEPTNEITKEEAKNKPNVKQHTKTENNYWGGGGGGGEGGKGKKLGENIMKGIRLN